MKHAASALDDDAQRDLVINNPAAIAADDICSSEELYMTQERPRQKRNGLLYEINSTKKELLQMCSFSSDKTFMMDRDAGRDTFLLIQENYVYLDLTMSTVRLKPFQIHVAILGAAHLRCCNILKATYTI